LARRARGCDRRYDIVEFGGKPFAHDHEWDRCLISVSVRSAGAQRRLSGVLAARPGQPS